MDFPLALVRFSVAFVPLMLGIILHEVAHGWVALLRGDPTASQLGRLTLNPIPHIDLVGLLVFVITSIAGSFVFGWAKPVPINPGNFKHFVRDTMLVSFAGPASNFLLAIFFAICLNLLITFFPPATDVQNSPTIWKFCFYMFRTGIIINLCLAWINLLPIPPLDGSKILWGLLPPEIGFQYMKLEKYGMLIILLLIATNVLGSVLMPLVEYSFHGIIAFFVTG